MYCCEPYTITLPVAMSSVSDSLYPAPPENYPANSKPNICRPVYTDINKIPHVGKNYALKSKLTKIDVINSAVNLL